MSKRTPLPDRPLVFSLARARPARGRPRGADHTRGPWQFLRMQEMMKTAPPPLAKVEDVPLLDVAEADVVAPASSVSEQTNASAFNLRLVYMETAFHYLSLSLWHGVILSQWMYLLSSDTRIVGIAEGLPGIAKLVAAVAAAVVVDACPRNPLLLWSGVGGIAVHALMAGLVVAGDTVPLQVWYGALSLHAVYAVMQQVLTDAVFADSVATGARAGPYTMLYLIRQFSGLASPLLQLGYFALVPNANHWTEATLRPAMLAGIGAGAVSCLLVASLDQSRTLGLASEAAHVASPALPPDASQTGIETTEKEEATAAAATRVRWLLLLYDLMRVGFGGIVNKFVGLFFTTTFGVLPVGLALLQLSCAVLSCIGTLTAGRLARLHLRRGTICLSLLVICDVANVVVALSSSMAVDAAAWVVREGSLEAVFGLKKSLMMDHTPKKSRGRWNAVDSLQSSVWAGTAAAGGFVIHAYGYRAALAVMSGGFICATLAFAPLANKR